MVENMGTLFVIIGGLAIAGGILGKEFYIADIITLSPYKDKEKMPKWAGRLMFIVVGVLFVALGIKFLLSS